MLDQYIEITVINLAIYQKQKVARFTSSLWQFYDLHEIPLTKKRLCWSEAFLQGACHCLVQYNMKKLFSFSTPVMKDIRQLKYFLYFLHILLDQCVTIMV